MSLIRDFSQVDIDSKDYSFGGAADVLNLLGELQTLLTQQLLPDEQVNLDELQSQLIELDRGIGEYKQILLDSQLLNERQKRAVKSHKFLSRKLHRQLLQKSSEIASLAESRDYYKNLSQRYLADIGRKASQLKLSEHRAKDFFARYKHEQQVSDELRQSLELAESGLAERVTQMGKLEQAVLLLQSEKDQANSETLSQIQKNEALIHQNHLLNEEIQQKDSRIAQLESELADLSRKKDSELADLSLKMESELADRDLQLEELNLHLDACEKLADEYWNKNKRLAEKIEQLSQSLTFRMLYKDKLDYEES